MWLVSDEKRNPRHRSKLGVGPIFLCVIITSMAGFLPLRHESETRWNIPPFDHCHDWHVLQVFPVLWGCGPEERRHSEGQPFHVEQHLLMESYISAPSPWSTLWRDVEKGMLVVHVV